MGVGDEEHLWQFVFKRRGYLLSRPKENNVLKYCNIVFLFITKRLWLENQISYFFFPFLEMQAAFCISYPDKHVSVHLGDACYQLIVLFETIYSK